MQKALLVNICLPCSPEGLSKPFDLYFKGSDSILFFNGSAINIRGTGVRLFADNIRGMTLFRSADINNGFIKK